MHLLTFPVRKERFLRGEQRTFLIGKIYRRVRVSDSPVHVPQECSCLTAELVAELSRVRTDRDAIEER
jgi:hypothetical protein